MFETSHVGSRVAAQQRYGLFSVSVAIHTAVVVAIVMATLSSLKFPLDPPSQLPRYLEPVRVTIPPPAGRREAPRPATPVQPSRPVAARTAVAPAQIPDTVQPFPTATTADPDLPIGNGPPSGAVGDEGGVEGGIDVENPQPAAEAPDRIYQPVGEVRPAVVLKRVEPQYPHAALTGKISGVVILECVIDKEGQIRDAHVVSSSFGIFEEPALTALRQWKFAPGVLRGRPVDTWFRLTVAFQPR